MTMTTPVTAPSDVPAPTRPAPRRRGEELAVFVQMFDSLVSNVTKVLHGKETVVRAALTCVLAEGHLLIEDVPGVGKTSLARAICKSVNLTWNRVQFTPDLLPSDITGVTVFDQATSTFNFRPARCSPTSSSATR